MAQGNETQALSKPYASGENNEHVELRSNNCTHNRDNGTARPVAAKALRVVVGLPVRPAAASAPGESARHRLVRTHLLLRDPDFLSSDGAGDGGIVHVGRLELVLVHLEEACCLKENVRRSIFDQNWFF